MVAGYVDGDYRWTAKDWTGFPDAVKVGIATSADTDDGEVLDVERYDATVDEAPRWVLMRRAAGVDPSVYCNMATWDPARQAFADAAVPEPHWWVAAWPGAGELIPAGAVAHQYLHPGPYDLSSVVDYWPGVDPPPRGAPLLTGPGADEFDEEAQMLVFVSTGQQHTVTVDQAGELVHRFYTIPAPGRPGGWAREVRATGCTPGAPVGFDPDFGGQLHLYADRPDGRQQHCYYTPAAGWLSELLD
jgi:hypothetical protein